MSGRFGPELVSLIITPVTLVTFWGVTGVAGVIAVTKKLACAKKVAQGVFGDPDFSLELQRKVGVCHFL